MRRRVALVAALAVALLGLVGAPIASAGLDDQTALAKRYSPVLRVATDRECGPGEPYLPMDIDRCSETRGRAARAVGRGDLVKIAPTAEDLEHAALRLPPRLPRRRARPRLRVRAVGASG